MSIQQRFIKAALSIISFILVMVFTFTGCDDSSGGNDPGKVGITIPVTGISLNASSIYAEPGNTEQLTATVEPATATNRNVTWESDTTSVTVTTDGLVSVVAYEESTITVTTEDGGYSATCVVNRPFVTTWNTALTNGESTASDQVKLPLDSGGTYNFYVVWGDGTTDTITAYDQAETTHTYSAEGTYDVQIYGIIEGFGFSSSSGEDRVKLLDVKKWGNVRMHNKGYQFYNTANLTGFSAADTPNLSNITNMIGMFSGASTFNGNISSWDVSGVKDMRSMFSNAISFNQDISSWDVSDVENMTVMFHHADEFNQDIGNWNVSKVENMTSMFAFTTEFNQDISGWDVSSVTNMTGMFYNATSFNQDIGDWQVNKVEHMETMFLNASSFNQDIGNWDVSNVENMSFMFMSASSFNQDISGWDVSSVTNMSSMFYNASDFSGHDLSGWVVTLVTDHTDFSTGWGTGNTEPVWP